MTKLERAILAHLQVDPCVTQGQLALALEVTRTTCKKALDRLEAKGHLRGYGFILNGDMIKTPENVEGYVFIPGPQDRSKIENLEYILSSHKDIGHAHLITGGNFDYIFVFSVPQKSIKFIEFLEKIRKITSTETHNVVRII